MEEEYGYKRVAAYSSEYVILSLGKHQQSKYECHKHRKHKCGTHESLFLADGAEDEVGILFGHIFQFRLCAVKESFSHKSTRTYCNLRLVHVVSGTGKVFF